MSKFVAFLRDESGASAAEYVLILAIIGGAIVIAASTLGNSIGGAMTNAASYIDAHSTFPTS